MGPTNGHHTCSSGDYRDSDMAPSTAFSVLAHAHRRGVLYYFLKQETGLGELDQICGFMSDNLTSVSADPEAIETALCHQHLPKLEDTGLIEYDLRSATVCYDGDPLVEQCLSLVSHQDFD